MAKKSGLGKGLSSIFNDATLESGSSAQGEYPQSELPIDSIKPNPDQPRKVFDQDDLKDLSDSISKEGLLQPIIVRKVDDSYQIVAGERRWQACKLAGLKTVPVRVVELDDISTLRVALIENLQRSDLNAMEEARGYKELMEKGDMTQSQLAEAVSKSRPAVANAMRLLDLPEAVQEYVYTNKISAGHARALLGLEDEVLQLKLAEKTVTDKLSVRDVERLVKLWSANRSTQEKAPTPRSYKRVAKSLRTALDAPVRISSARGKNKIAIEFSSEEDLARIVKIICSKD